MRELFTKKIALPVFLLLAVCFVPSLGTQSAFAQSTITVTGMVKDSQGAAIAGATIVGEDGRTGTISDAEGNFSLRVPSGSELTVSFIGYQTRTVTAGSEPVAVVLPDDLLELEAVQVVAYGVQRKVSVTGAIAAVGNEELTRTPVSSVNNVLSGLMTGITTVQYSGEPGEDAAQIFVRGKGTFGDANPLVQVDGVERSMNSIDPNEIESITVLKDASATAVFGVRGANGVILITTKRGQEGRTRINFSTSASLLFPTKLIETANSYEYATFYNMMHDLAGTPTPFSDQVIAKFRDHSDPIRFPDTDWIDYVMKDVTTQTQHNINISGGTNSVRYFVSAGLHTQGGMFKDFGAPYDMTGQYERYNYRTNLDIDATPTTTVSLNLSGNVGNSSRGQNSDGFTGLIRGLYWATPFSSPGLVDGRRVNAATDYADGVNMPFTGSGGMGYWGGGFYATNRNVLNADLMLNQKLDFITRNLSFSVKGSYNGNFTVNKTGNAATASYTPVLQPDGTLAYKKSGQDNQVSYDEDSSRGRNWYMEAALNWNREFGDHHVSALALYNQSKNYYPRTLSDIPSGYVGLVGRVTYNWNNRYMAEFNMGYNGSENFHPDRRFGFFPAGSVGWNVSEENFWGSIKPVVNYLKLRASWGLVGNDKVGGDRFMYLADPYSIGNTTLPSREGQGYYFGINRVIWPGARELSRNNPMVTWEKAFKQNYGVDFSILRERLTTSIDYYREERTDILLKDAAVPTITGIAAPYANMGAVDSWGWELALRWNDRIGENFRYYVGLNLSHNDSEIIERKEIPYEYPWMYQKGHRVGARNQAEFWRFYDSDAESLYQQQFGTPLADHGLTLRPGDPVFVDLNGDGVIGPEDNSYAYGYTDDPRYIAGLNMGFTWKNFDVALQWTGAWQVSRTLGDVFQRPFVKNDNKTQGGLLRYHLTHSWTEDNPSQSAQYPRPSWPDREANSYRGSTLYEVDASYLRLKSMQIAYNFHFPFMEKIKLETFQLALSGYNLLTFTDFIWGDPESRTSGSPEYPLQRSFSLSLRLGF